MDDSPTISPGSVKSALQVLDSPQKYMTYKETVVLINHMCRSDGATTLNPPDPEPIASTRSSVFCLNTSVHGFKYLYGLGRPCMDRSFWRVAMLVSLILCVNSIHELWVEWRENNIVMISADKSNSDVPFPAVTICSETLVNAEVLNLSMIDHYFSEELWVIRIITSCNLSLKQF